MQVTHKAGGLGLSEVEKKHEARCLDLTNHMKENH